MATPAQPPWGYTQAVSSNHTPELSQNDAMNSIVSDFIVVAADGDRLVVTNCLNLE